MKSLSSLTLVPLLFLFTHCTRYKDFPLPASAEEATTTAITGLSALTAEGYASDYDLLVLSHQPVAFWDVAGNDIATNAHPATVMNNPDISALPNGDQATLLNGINQYMEIATAADLSVANTGTLTLEAWIRPDVLSFPDEEGSGYVSFIGKGSAGTHEYAARIYGQSPTGNDAGRINRITGQLFTGNGKSLAGSYYQPAEPWPLQAGEWLHYVLVMDNTPSAGYPNGYTKLYVQRKNNNDSIITLIDQDACNSDSPGSGNAPLRIGAKDLQSFFKGAVGKVAVYNYALSSELVLEHAKKMYGYDYQILKDQPVAFWNVSGKDISHHGHTGMIANGPGTTLMPDGSQSLVFNGTSQYMETAAAPDLSVPATGVLTLEAWIRPDMLSFPDEEGSGYVHWMGKGITGAHEYASRMYGQHPAGNDSPRINRVSGYAFSPAGGLGAGSYYQASLQWPVAAGEWIHYVLVINSTQTSTSYPTGYTKLIIHRRETNGNIATFTDQDALADYSIIPQAGAAPFRIGTRDFQSYFAGAIGKVTVYNYELSSATALGHAEKMFQ